MVKNFKSYFVFGSLILAVVFAAVFVMALEPGIPTGLTFELNTTPSFDEGNFTLNWTAAIGSNATAYNITIWVDDVVWITNGANDSALGYSFNNWTDANYTFAVASWNSTDDQGENSTNISMVVDRTFPQVATAYPTNISYATAPTQFNYTYVETNCDKAWFSNDTGITNYSEVACGTNWTGLVTIEGLNNWTVFVNDSAGNENSSVIFFTVDTINPVASAVCSPATVSAGVTVTCTCSGTDGGSGINAALTTAVSTPSTPSGGTFSYACSVTDNAGNSDSTSTSYTVLSSAGGGSGSYPTYSPSESKLVAGYDISLGRGYKVNFNLEGESHRLTVDSISSDSATITISSSHPVTLSVAVDDTEMVDVDGDGDVDLSVYLKAISSGKANFVLTSIENGAAVAVSEGVDDVSDTSDVISGDVVSEVDKESPRSDFIFWVVVVIIIIGLIIFGMRVKDKRKRARKK